jgi:2-oxoglutarate ferredoxin oxidoreductase subunit alpha
MMDECVGHMTEKVKIPPAGQIEIVPRRYTQKPREEYRPFRPDADGVPEMVQAGEGYRFHITGLTHDERGYPVMNADAQRKLVTRLLDKIRNNAESIVRCEEVQTEDADVIVVAYGITARVALRAVQMARAKGIAAGLLRLLTVWPFPGKRIRELARREGTSGIIVPEMNLGQMVYEVERCAAGRVPVVLVPHAGGSVHHPEEILEAIVRMAAVEEEVKR